MRQGQTRAPSLGEVARRCGWALLVGLVLGMFALAIDPAPLALKVALSVVVALVLPLPGILLAHEDIPGAANAPGTLLSLLGLGALVGALVTLETLLSTPLAGHLVLVVPLLLALLPGYMQGAHGRRLGQTWPMGVTVGVAAWLGFALLIVLLAALFTAFAISSSTAFLPPIPLAHLTTLLDNQLVPFALGLPGAVVGGVVGACLRVLPIARAACPDEVDVEVTAMRTSPPALP